MKPQYGILIAMAIIIKLSRTGKRGERKFRVIVKEKRSKRDGKAIETLGWYNKTETEEHKKIDDDRVAYWLSKGAKPTPSVAKLIQS